MVPHNTPRLPDLAAKSLGVHDMYDDSYSAAHNLSHVAAGANWSMPATVHLWRSNASVKVLVGNLESWWWPTVQPSVPVTPGMPRTVRVVLNSAHLGLAMGTAGSCWKLVPLLIHDGAVPAGRAVGIELPPVHAQVQGDGESGGAYSAASAGAGAAVAGAAAMTAGNMLFELSVSARGMGLWELQRCS